MHYKTIKTFLQKSKTILASFVTENYLIALGQKNIQSMMDCPLPLPQKTLPHTMKDCMSLPQTN